MTAASFRSILGEEGGGGRRTPAQRGPLELSALDLLLVHCRYSVRARATVQPYEMRRVTAVYCLFEKQK